MEDAATSPPRRAPLIMRRSIARLVSALALFPLLSAAAVADGVAWTFRESVPFSGEVACADGRIAYPLADGSLVLRDAATGQELMRRRAGGRFVAALPFRDELLLVGATGELLLQKAPGDFPPFPLDAVADPRVPPSRLSAEVVVASDRGEVLRIDLAKRAVAAQGKLPAPAVAVAALPVGAFAAESAGEVIVFDAFGGETARYAGELKASSGGAALVRGPGAVRIALPSGTRLRAAGPLGTAGDGLGNACLFARNELRLLRDGRSDETVRLDETVRHAAFSRGRVAALLATNDLVLVDAARLAPVATVELGIRHARVLPASGGWLLVGTDAVSFLSAAGTRAAAPRDAVRPLTTVFGASGAELVSERWRFLAIAPEPGERRLHLLARRGEGRQRLLRFTGFSSPLHELVTLPRAYDRIVRLTDEILLVRTGPAGRADAWPLDGGPVRELRKGRIDDFAVALGRVLLLDRSAEVVLDAETGEPLPVGPAVDLAPARAGGDPALLVVCRDGDARQAFLFDRALSVVATLPLTRYAGLARALPDEVSLLHRARQIVGGDALHWRKAGMAAAREIAAFAKDQYTLDRIEVDAGGLFGLYTLRLAGRDTTLLSVFAPRGALLRNLALETDLSDACFGDRGTVLFTAAREEEMGALRGYFLEGESGIW